MNIASKMLEFGAVNVSEIQVLDIPFEPEFRKFCKQNYCGKFGTNHACPPYIGQPEELIENARKYDRAIVYQTISSIEDAYDFEGMMDAGDIHFKLAKKITNFCRENNINNILNLGAGACTICAECTAPKGEPCRFPDERMATVDSYCVDVSNLSKKCGMKYINGENTVTYFGVLLLKD